MSLVLVGCASTASFTRLNETTYDAKPKNCEIAVLSEDPQRPHEKLGFVTGVSGQTAFSSKSLKGMLPSMKEQACLAGADALVLKHVEEGGVAWIAPTQGKASGLAIRYLEPIEETAR